jgi:hypothetical protein
VIEAVRAALLDAFGFARRRFGQDVTAAEVVTVIHSVAGVQAVNLTALHLVTEGASGSTTLSSRLSAEPARWSEGSLVQADLLRINPAGIQLTVVQS